MHSKIIKFKGHKWGDDLTSLAFCILIRLLRSFNPHLPHELRWTQKTCGCTLWVVILSISCYCNNLRLFGDMYFTPVICEDIMDERKLKSILMASIEVIIKAVNLVVLINGKITIGCLVVFFFFKVFGTKFSSKIFCTFIITLKYIVENWFSNINSPPVLIIWSFIPNLWIALII